MEKFIIGNDITVMCVKADSFPQGIEAAHQKLHRLVSFSLKRGYYGISRPENGPIVYRAAAGVLEAGEPGKYGLETFVIPRGTYICQTLHHYRQDPAAIGHCFKKLLQEKGIDPQGFCLEWYFNEHDVRCMVGLAEPKP